LAPGGRTTSRAMSNPLLSSYSSCFVFTKHPFQLKTVTTNDMFSKYVLFKKRHLNKRAGVWTPWTPPCTRHCMTCRKSTQINNTPRLDWLRRNGTVGAQPVLNTCRPVAMQLFVRSGVGELEFMWWPTSANLRPPKTRHTTPSHRHDTIRYDTRCYFNVRAKTDTSQLNLPNGTNN